MTRIGPTLIYRFAPLLRPALVVGVLACSEDAQSPTPPGSGPALDVTPAHVLSFRQLSGGRHLTCGVTTDDRAYCWGTTLGDGSGSGRSLTPVAVAGGLNFRHVSAGTNHACAVTIEDRAYC